MINPKIESNFLGMAMKSPLILASGPLSYCAQSMIEAFEHGAGAVVTKTISLEPAKNPINHIVEIENSLLNCEKWSDISYKKWINNYIPASKKKGLNVIASIGLSTKDVKKLAKAIVTSRADVIELVSYESDQLIQMVKLAKKMDLGIPIIAKISFNWKDLEEVISSCINYGIDGIDAIDSIGPALRIDINSGMPYLGSKGGFGWLSGSSIFPIALATVAKICSKFNIPVIGTGGISNLENVLEMIMAGVSAIGICSLALTKGIGIFEKLNKELFNFLKSRKIKNLWELKGYYFRKRPQYEIFEEYDIYLDEEKCNLCGICVEICPYNALELIDNKIKLDRDSCHMCGLCKSICPKNSIDFVAI